MEILLRCYTSEFGFYWVSHLSMAEFYYDCYIHEASKYSSFEVSYGFQLATLADRLWLLPNTPRVADGLSESARVRDFVRELLILFKQRTAAHSSRPAPIFAIGNFVFLSSKGLHIHSQKCEHLID